MPGRFQDDGETIKDEDHAGELVQDCFDMLEQFAPAYAYFGAHAWCENPLLLT